MSTDSKISNSPEGGLDLAVKEPPLYCVFLLNDDFTPMDFVVETLIKVFHKSPEESKEIMLKVHTEGKALSGVFPKSIAETKALIVHQNAKRNDYPLRCHIEPEDNDS